MKPPLIWLCDLTYTQQTISNDTIPAAIGGIATTIVKYNPEAKIKLFKFPNKLSEATNKVIAGEKMPDIISFSNYSWNYNLSYKICSQIKFNFPNIVTASGG